jgi:hypothetical protein
MDRPHSPHAATIPLTQRKPNVQHRQRNQRERWIMIGTVAIIVAAWLYGYFNGGVDASAQAGKVLPGAVTIDRTGNLFIGRNADGDLVGYAGVGRGMGYGGPMEVIVGVDSAGNILGVEMVEERESPGFFRLVRNSKLFESYTRQQIADPLQLGQDLDAISGATMSAEGVANAVREAVRDVAAGPLQTPLPPQIQRIQVGLPEGILVLLFVSGYIGHKLRKPRAKKMVRWGTLIAGMITIGFIYTLPLTISMIVSLMSGYWPDWQTNLYWYLLIGGILFVTTVDAKNPYCSWFCPFGAFQECLAAVSQAKVYRPRDLNVPLTWLQRGLSLTAIVLGLALRQPGAASYEPFATLFDMRGSAVQWALLVILILASLMMYRPFCNYLCPLDPVVDFIAAGRRWIKELWSTWRKQPLKQENAQTSEG